MKLREMIRRIIKEETSENPLTINVGGTRYEISRDGSITRMGSEKMNYGSVKFVGATNSYGRGNRHFTKNDIDISLEDIFNNPQILKGKYPLVMIDGRLQMNLGGVKESDNRVIWAMIH